VSPRDPSPADPGPPPLRPFGLVLHRDGSWTHEAVAITHPRLRAAFDQVVASPEITASLEKRGARPIRLSIPETEALVARDIDRWTPLIRSAGIRAD